MKIKKSQLKQIIMEELQSLLSEYGGFDHPMPEDDPMPEVGDIYAHNNDPTPESALKVRIEQPSPNDKDIVKFTVIGDGFLQYGIERDKVVKYPKSKFYKSFSREEEVFNQETGEYEKVYRSTLGENLKETKSYSITLDVMKDYLKLKGRDLKGKTDQEIKDAYHTSLGVDKDEPTASEFEKMGYPKKNLKEAYYPMRDPNSEESKAHQAKRAAEAEANPSFKRRAEKAWDEFTKTPAGRKLDDEFFDKAFRQGEGQEEYNAMIEDWYREKEQSSGTISEGFRHHIHTATPLTNNVYRVGSHEYFKVIKEAREAYNKATYFPINEEEREMLDSDLGEWVMFEGERVPLDFPMYAETLEERKKKKKKKKDPPIGKPMKGSGGKKYQVYVRNKKTGRIKKISYGDSKGGLKGNWNSSEARTNFANRHRCAEKKDRTKAGYWACRAHKDFGTNVPGRFW